MDSKNEDENSNVQFFLKFNFIFRVGFPVMLGNVLLVTVYLIVVHVLFEWN